MSGTRGILKRAATKLSPLFGDKTYVSLMYYLYSGCRLHLDDPKTFREKLQWLKLNFREPMMTAMVDKLAVKDYVRGILGDEYVIPVIAEWDTADAIDFASLPHQFVLKTTHSGGNTGVVICSDKEKLNTENARHKLSAAMGVDVYQRYREWPYKNVKKKIFAEQFLGNDLTDYKFYCFNGVADSVLICVDRQKGAVKYYFFDRNWHLCRYNKWGIEASEDFTLPRPQTLDRMFELAANLSKGFPFIRVDFYDVGGNIYFGEFTFYPSSGFSLNGRTEETDKYFGNMIDLSIVKRKT